jgi:hypothetical protein
MRLTTAIYFFATLCSQPLMLLPAHAVEIWLAPQAFVPPSPVPAAADFMDMFKPNAPWKRAASHVNVFALYGNFAAHAPQHQIDTVISDLERRQIALALEVGVMNVGAVTTHPSCGGLGLVEGYGTPDEAKNISAKIKHAGGELKYIVMDEPLWYGHYYTGRPGTQPGCRSTISEVGDLAAPTLGVYKQEFPAVAVGEVEPTMLAEKPDGKARLLEWAKEFLAATGHPLAFLQLDNPLHVPGGNNVSASASDAVAMFRYAQELRRQNLLESIGIIYNGVRDDTDSYAWMNNARDHVRILEDRFGLHPDQAVIQSWMSYPTHTMPESSDEALTNLVLFYVSRTERHQQ